MRHCSGHTIQICRRICVVAFAIVALLTSYTFAQQSQFIDEDGNPILSGKAPSSRTHSSPTHPKRIEIDLKDSSEGKKIGIDAVNGSNGDNILYDGSNFDEFRTKIDSMGHTLVPVYSFMYDELSEVDMLIVKQPYPDTNPNGFLPDMIDSIHKFVEIKAGGLLIMAEVGVYDDDLEANFNDLVNPYGVSLDSGPSENNGHTITDFLNHPVTEGITSIGVDGQRRITSFADPAVDLTTGSGADDFIAAIFGGMGHGNVVIISDTTIWKDTGLTTDRDFGFDDNELLLENVINFITTHTSTQTITPTETSSPTPSATQTPTPSPTPSITPTETSSPTPTPSITPTPPPTPPSVVIGLLGDSILYSQLGVEEQTAYSWALNNDYYAASYVSFDYIESVPSAIDEMDLLWWHFVGSDTLSTDSLSLNQAVMGSLKSFLASGKGIFLSGMAAQYVFNLGLESNNPTLDQFDVEGIPYNVGIKKIQSLHPIFNSLPDPFYLVEEGLDVTLNLCVWNSAGGGFDGIWLGDFQYPQGYVTCGEYHFGNGSVIILGSESYDWHIDEGTNSYHTNIETFTDNIIQYLANSSWALSVDAWQLY